MTTNLENTDQSLARMRLGGGFAWELMGVSKDPKGNQEDAQQDTSRSSATGHDANALRSRSNKKDRIEFLHKINTSAKAANGGSSTKEALSEGDKRR